MASYFYKDGKRWMVVIDGGEPVAALSRKDARLRVNSARLSEAHHHITCRMDCGESLDEAIEAVYPDYGDLKFARSLRVFACGVAR